MNGIAAWADLRGYSLLVFVYTDGIAALSSKNYIALASLLTRNNTKYLGEQRPLIIILVEKTFENKQADLFKSLAEYSQKHIPRSEYFFQTLQHFLECINRLPKRTFGYTDKGCIID